MVGGEGDKIFEFLVWPIVVDVVLGSDKDRVEEEQDAETEADNDPSRSCFVHCVMGGYVCS